MDISEIADYNGGVNSRSEVAMAQKSLLQQRNFVLLVLGKLVSLLGSNMQQFALSLYVLAITGSATVFASMLSISILPRLLFSPIAGVFGDWFDRKKTIVFLDFLNAIIIGIYGLLLFIRGDLSLPLIYILVVTLEITEIFFGSAMTGIMPSIVAKEQLLEANSFSSLALNIGQLLAPVIAATVYGLFGLQVVLIVNAVSFLLSAISELFIQVPHNHKRPEKINIHSFKRDLRDGVETIRNNRMLSTIISVGTVINFSIAPLFSVGLIFITKEVLKASDMQFGLFQMVFAASMIIAPLISAKFVKKVVVGKLLFRSFFTLGCLILLMAVIPTSFVLTAFDTNLVPLLLLLSISFCVGIVATIANIAIGTLFQQTTPIDMLGRVGAVSGLAITVFIPLGQMLFGFLYDRIAPSLVILLSGVLLLLANARSKEALFNASKPGQKHAGDVIASEV